MKCCERPDIELVTEEGFECRNCGMVHGHRQPDWYKYPGPAYGALPGERTTGIPPQWNDRSLFTGKALPGGARTNGHAHSEARAQRAKPLKLSFQESTVDNHEHYVDEEHEDRGWGFCHWPAWSEEDLCDVWVMWAGWAEAWVTQQQLDDFYGKHNPLGTPTRR